jgi:hypothetical protein
LARTTLMRTPWSKDHCAGSNPAVQTCGSAAVTAPRKSGSRRLRTPTSERFTGESPQGGQFPRKDEVAGSIPAVGSPPFIATSDDRVRRSQAPTPYGDCSSTVSYCCTQAACWTDGNPPRCLVASRSSGAVGLSDRCAHAKFHHSERSDGFLSYSRTTIQRGLGRDGAFRPCAMAQGYWMNSSRSATTSDTPIGSDAFGQLLAEALADCEFSVISRASARILHNKRELAPWDKLPLRRKAQYRPPTLALGVPVQCGHYLVHRSGRGIGRRCDT